MVRHNDKDMLIIMIRFGTWYRLCVLRSIARNFMLSKKPAWNATCHQTYFTLVHRHHTSWILPAWAWHLHIWSSNLALPPLKPWAYGQSPWTDSGVQRVWLKHILDVKGWWYHARRRFPGSTNLSSDNLSREIGRALLTPPRNCSHLSASVTP